MAASTVDKYAYLADKLYEKTLRKEIKWEIISKKVYSCSLDSYSIVINEGGEFNSDIIISITDESGAVVDTFSDVTLTDAKPRVGGFSSYYSLLEDLFERAGRDATGAERILDGILDILGVDISSIPVRDIKKSKSEEIDDEIPF